MRSDNMSDHKVVIAQKEESQNLVGSNTEAADESVAPI